MATERKKFSRKRNTVNADEDIGDDFFDRMVEEISKDKDHGFIVPSGVNEPLVQVNTFIPMPKPISRTLSCPGVPCGLITEVFGPPDAGKSTFCIETLKQCQMAGGVPILMLSELKFDLKRAADVGLDVKRILIKKPKTIEDVQEYIHDIVFYLKKVKSKRPVTVVLDSLSATPCRKELDEKRGDFAGDQAAAITIMLRKTQALIRDHNIAFVMINQISVKIGAMAFGKKTDSKGGYAPKFYSALRIEFAKIGRVRADDDEKGSDFCGIKTKMTVEKNHIGTPFKSLIIPIDYKGFVIDRDIERKPEPAEDVEEVKPKKNSRKKVEESEEEEFEVEE